MFTKTLILLQRCRNLPSDALCFRLSSACFVALVFPPFICLLCRSLPAFRVMFPKTTASKNPLASRLDDSTALPVTISSPSSKTAILTAGSMPSMDNHPAIVKEAIGAQKDLLDAVKLMTSCKEDCRKIAKVVQHIVTCVENSSSRAHHGGRKLIISLPARCALDVTIQTLKKCAAFMTKASSRGIFGRVQKNKETSTIILNYIAA
ncbi:hypothetical protein BKA62DRAFT_792932, partial [Auriculariales sp. MPI-PUGE-AT-0066]